MEVTVVRHGVQMVMIIVLLFLLPTGILSICVLRAFCPVSDALSQHNTELSKLEIWRRQTPHWQDFVILVERG